MTSASEVLSTPTSIVRKPLLQSSGHYNYIIKNYIIKNNNLCLRGTGLILSY